MGMAQFVVGNCCPDASRCRNSVELGRPILLEVTHTGNSYVGVHFDELMGTMSYATGEDARARFAYAQGAAAQRQHHRRAGESHNRVSALARAVIRGTRLEETGMLRTCRVSSADCACPQHCRRLYARGCVCDADSVDTGARSCIKDSQSPFASASSSTSNPLSPISTELNTEAVTRAITSNSHVVDGQVVPPPAALTCRVSDRPRSCARLHSCCCMHAAEPQGGAVQDT